MIARHWVAPPDLNPHETLFGGRLLSWIDQAAAIHAAIALETPNIVTKFISDIEFLAPAHLKHLIEIHTRIEAVGNTSITIRVQATDETAHTDICEVKSIVFVALDEKGRRTPHYKTIKDFR